MKTATQTTSMRSAASDMHGVLQIASIESLTALVSGACDLETLVRAELAGRGLDGSGRWVGFAEANQIHGVRTLKVRDGTDTERHLARVVMGRHGPASIVLHGVTYAATGKKGNAIATGRPTVEMASATDERIWAAVDGAEVWVD